MKKSLTGGVLNTINEKYQCAAKNKTVSIMNLIRYHKPKQKEVLVELIKNHQVGHENEKCACGSRSKGTIKDFGLILYEANLRHFKDDVMNVKSKLECIKFMYHLFITQSIKGDLKEDECLNVLKDRIKYDIECATEQMDFKYAVDLILKKDGEIIGGVQVKPTSYKLLNIDNSIVLVNKKKNKLFDKPVLYCYYDSITGEFEEIEKLTNKINNL